MNHVWVLCTISLHSYYILMSTHVQVRVPASSKKPLRLARRVSRASDLQRHKVHLFVVHHRLFMLLDGKQKADVNNTSGGKKDGDMGGFSPAGVLG